VGPRRADAANGQDRLAATRWTAAVIVLGNRQRGLDAGWEDASGPIDDGEATSDASVGTAVAVNAKSITVTNSTVEGL
jgi:hypothetical protein